MRLNVGTNQARIAAQNIKCIQLTKDSIMSYDDEAEVTSSTPECLSLVHPSHLYTAATQSLIK